MPTTAFTLPARNGPIMRHFISEYREGGMSCAFPAAEARVPTNKKKARETTTSSASLTLRECSDLMAGHPHRRRLMEQWWALCLDRLQSDGLYSTQYSRLGCP